MNGIPGELIELGNAHVRIAVDPGLGADVVELVDLRTGIDVLFRTPWHERADAVRAGQRSAAEPDAAWLEQYRGGWQTLCPVAGAPRPVHGAPVGFHGEAARIPWQTKDVSPTEVSLAAELFSLPVRIDRLIRLAGPRVVVCDTVRNLSLVPLRFDYVHHPAFGGAFVGGPLRLETNARKFTPDPDRGSFLGGDALAWPQATLATGERIDLSDVPAPGTAREVFGWFSDFEVSNQHNTPWVRIVNPALRLAVRVSWTGLPYAWLWQELEYTETFPWFRRARAIAIEPASVATSGPARVSDFTIAGHGVREVTVTVELQEGGTT